MNNRLLIVDDVLFMRVRLRSIVEKFGYQVIGEAANGHEAITKYQYLNPDAILLDITMPQMDGVDCLQAIKKIDPAAKVIMVSAMGQGSFIKQCFKYGAEYFICKPFEEAKLKKVLDAVLPIAEEKPAEEEFDNYEAKVEALTVHHDALLTSVIDVKRRV